MSLPPPLYSTRVLELFRSLPGSDALPEEAGAVVTGEAIALDRGAWVRLTARVWAGRIVACRFQAWGCPHTLAAAALAADWLARPCGSESPACEAAALLRELVAPPGKMGRFLVVEDAARALIAEAGGVQ